ncbi:hypothetical protein NXS98_08895 [Fontisphaera persica]|uniref:hypothetical protein n=1 Tax=Fontisphaera persica TaxID=2974023 RepID=UPI0024C0431F|nr:hypothetical protein [Fontisphaera persica]WCJ57850.1 hypothetical protein NXS98_08895 [Fontisphaera persica]
MKSWSGLLALLLLGNLMSAAELGISGTRFTLDGKPFPFTGVSFFNAIYNPTFNQDSASRRRWLDEFRAHGINVLRVWCQWDNARGFVDAGPEATIYKKDGALRPGPLATLKAILADADAVGFVIELCLFSQESYREGKYLEPAAQDKAVAALTRELKPWRNVAFQIWNEKSHRTLELLRVIKAEDARRLVTSSPGVAGVLGSDEENAALDFLTPHTTRQGKGRHWEIAPREIASLLVKFKKPVVDDEPARNGTPQFGGPRGATSPYDHILQIYAVWQLGAYVVYHHDMFQTGYGTPACPPSGIPEPRFSPYHRVVFEFLAQRERYWNEAALPPKP